MSQNGHCGSELVMTLQEHNSHQMSGERNRAVVVLGAQWGDEGKGKLIDLLADQFDVVCRLVLHHYITLLFDSLRQLILSVKLNCFRGKSAQLYLFL